ncbi:MAG: fatty acid desaturase [Alphaproteobacteria bacterium HGW-Alphaproteobacteria-6]|nr:MAG: fatty acid desaturase [Alphaproteobacteria bacterium HGW-Alphaproteobacteria-6]
MADPRGDPGSDARPEPGAAPCARVEAPTLALIVICHLLWGLGTTALAEIWLPLGMLATTLAITLHSSLQHEALHGHPTRSRALNEALVFLPLGLVFPYGRFRDLHLAHHRDAALTDPYDDPESNYLDPAVWARLPGPLRAILRINNTLAGRMILGPAISVLAVLRADLAALRAGGDAARPIRRAWLLHGAGLVLVGLWIGLAAMPWPAYLAAAYAGFSILKIRTYLEHRAHALARGRTVIVEARGVLSFLFLNNSLHAVHHARPNAPWYRLPALYQAARDDYRRRNEGYVYPSYGAIFRRHFLSAKDPVPHPLWPRS